jgi:hypothetical protein
MRDDIRKLTNERVKKYKNSAWGQVVVHFHKCKARALKEGTKFTITLDEFYIELMKQWDDERGVFVCKILNIPMVRNYLKLEENSITCDQINPGHGYIPGNIQFISFIANRCKSRLPCSVNGLEDAYNFIVYYCKLNGIEAIEKTDFHKSVEIIDEFPGHFFEKGEIVQKIKNRHDHQGRKTNVSSLIETFGDLTGILKCPILKRELTADHLDLYGLQMDRIVNSNHVYDGDSVQIISSLANLMKSNLVMDDEAIKMFKNIYYSLSLFLESYC